MRKSLMLALLGSLFIFGHALAMDEISTSSSVESSSVITSPENPLSKKEQRKARKAERRAQAAEAAKILETKIAQAEAQLLSRQERKGLSKAAKKQERQKRREVKAAKYLLKVARAVADGKVVGAIIVCFILGGLGIHRVIMGGSGLLILGYIFTIFGLFGLLPLIDFIRLIINPSHYEDNDKLFAAFM